MYPFSQKYFTNILTMVTNLFSILEETKLLRLLESSNINESLYNGTRLMISVLSAYISQHEILTSDKAVKIVEVNCIMLLLRHHMHERSFLCYRNDSSENLDHKNLIILLEIITF